MRSRPARLTIAAVAWIALGAAALFLVRTERQISELRAASRAFDLRAREITDALADVRVGQQAYVAAGQGAGFWIPKVGATTEAVTEAIRSLRPSATSAGARASLDEAARTIVEFGNVDKRARDYLKSEQQLMASDVIFTEGVETAAAAARQVESARLAEHQEVDRSEASFRKQDASAAGLAAGIVAIIALVLGFGGQSDRVEPEASVASAEPSPARQPGTDMRPPALSPILKNAAQLCTEFGRVRDLGDLQALLGRAAEMIDASGLVVWVGNSAGGDLRPALAHGYSPQVLGRMPTVPRSGDNAAAAAYRTGEFQIVLSRPGGLNGAIVAPILTSDGCVGALSAEIRGGGETSETVQSLAALVAAQLAALLVAAPSGRTSLGDNRAAATS